MKADLNSLPLELLGLVLSFLDAVSLTKVRATCKSLLSVVNSSIYATYTLELAINGFYGNTRYTKASVSERLHLLRRAHAGWTNPVKRLQFNVSDDDNDIWLLSGNLFAFKEASSQNIVFRRLPSAFSKPPEDGGLQEEDARTLCVPNIRIAAFGIDPSQDLLVIIQASESTGPGDKLIHRIHCWTISTGQKHPLCTKSTMDFESEHEYAGYGVQIFDDYFGTMIGTTLVIWNWKTGQIEMHIEGEQELVFTFLNESYVIMVLRDDTLDLLNFRKVDSKPTHHSNVKPFLCLQLPFELLGQDFTVSIDSEPPPSSFSSTSIPFYDDPEQFLYTLTVTPEDESGPWLFAIPRATFLRQIELEHASLTPRGTVVWEDWGPKGTRAFCPEDHSENWDDWPCASFGSMMVILDRGKDHALLYDFNQPRVKQHLLNDGPRLTPPCRSGEEVVVFAESRPVTFQKTEFTTALPFRLKAIPIPSAPTSGHIEVGVMCGENCIIFVHMGHDTVLTFSVMSFEL